MKFFCYPNEQWHMPEVRLTGSGLTLAEEYIFIWFWCYLWQSIAPLYYNAVLRRQLTLTEFYSKLNEAARALQSAIVSESDEALLNSRRKLSAQISEALRASFE